MNKHRILKYKGYTHLDIKKFPNDYYKRISNSKWIKSHGFYPFIHYQMIFNKYVENKELNTKKREKKTRDLYYSSHIDRYIYQYYANILNTKYNLYAERNGINKAITAYRKGFKGKCNINFAKEVLEFIKGTERSIIIVGDYKSFFDNLDHIYLKDKISSVLGIERLPDDQYKVFRSITKFTYFEMSDIEKYIGKKRNEMRDYEKYFNTDEFHKFKEKYLKINKKDFGIPQGSSISAVYSNIYMIKFDEELNNYVTARKGFYRRYCDDFIIVIPCGTSDVNELKMKYLKKLNDIISSVPRLEINLKKTEIFLYSNSKEGKLYGLNTKGKTLNYLGFNFDGHIVKIREKSLFKYYSRAFKKVRTVNSHKGKEDYFATKKSLYQLYTHLGDKKHSGKYGNFITYARRSHEVIDSSKLLKSEIRNQIKRHWKKINKRLCK